MAPAGAADPAHLGYGRNPYPDVTDDRRANPQGKLERLSGDWFARSRLGDSGADYSRSAKVRSPARRPVRLPAEARLRHGNH